MKTPFVPHGTKSICTNGLNPLGSDITVSQVNNSRVRLMGGKLMATEMDKPMNFACKWAGIIAAAIVALCVAMPFIVGLLVAVMVGVAASFSIGNAMCYIATMNTPWTHLHASVKIENKKTLTGKSTMQCMFGGSINIFFSPQVAGAQARKNATGNLFQIFMGGVGGAGVRGLFQLGKSLFAINKVLGFVGPAATIVTGYGINSVLTPLLDKTSDVASDIIVNNTNEDIDNIEVNPIVDQNTSTDMAKGTQKGLSDIKSSNERIHGDNDFRVEEVKASRDYGNQTKSSTMTEAHSNSKKAIAAGDQRPYKDIFAEELKKEHNLRKTIAEQRAQQNLNKLSKAENSKVLKREGGKMLRGFFGFVELVDVLANTASKVQEKKLEQWGDNEEARARAKVNVTEKQV